MRLLALDPGVTTGYCNGLIEDGLMVVVTGQHRWSQRDLYESIKLLDPEVIVYESFEFRRGSRDNLELYSRELIGVTELYIDQHDGVSGHVQSPSQVMMYFTDKKLKADGIYKPGRPHANDAARHLLYWFTFGPGYKYNTKGYESGV